MPLISAIFSQAVSSIEYQPLRFQHYASAIATPRFPSRNTLHAGHHGITAEFQYAFTDKLPPISQMPPVSRIRTRYRAAAPPIAANTIACHYQ